jgi:hypothetical protein
MKAVYDRAFQRMMSEGRGLSKQTIEALIDAGIDMPERLLFMDAKAISSLQGVGTTKLKEIRSLSCDLRTRTDAEEGHRPGGVTRVDRR